ncbi:MAG: pyridine nucleotide-disulfide oxidoreductase, partial [Lachnospiraceae bacterium]|nr:pyridine nucleotide-disulfide oxidoreductase [Lachnospiraceae bacterium]
VDYVSRSGEVAAEGALAYVNGKIDEKPEYVQTIPEGNVNFVVPQRIAKGGPAKVQMYMRVKHPDKKTDLEIREADVVIQVKKQAFVAPPEMISCEVEVSGNADVIVNMKEAENE